MIKGILIGILGIFAILDCKRGWIYSWQGILFAIISVLTIEMHPMKLDWCVIGMMPGIFLTIASVMSKERWVGKADGVIVLGIGLQYGKDILGILFLSSILTCAFLWWGKRETLPYLPVLFLTVLIWEGSGCFV